MTDPLTLHPWSAEVFAGAVPPRSLGSAVEWCARHVRLPGSARSLRFDPDQTPWVREPLERVCGGECKTVTIIGPVQSGKSVVGEASICHYLANENDGDVQYNWEDDRKAGARWDKRFERVLEACKPVMARAPALDRSEGKWKRGQVIFPHCNLTMQGVYVPEHLDSDTIRFSVNEEVHNWAPGMLAKAYGRTSAVWNAVVLNISNGPRHGSQVHEKFEQGTQQEWEVPCPTCGAWHAMKTKWDPARPELGGLRYDGEAARMPNGKYNYNLIERSLRYQFPCGHEVPDDKHLRREMSMKGRWSEPRNAGARLKERSYRLEAVSIDYVPWVTIVQEKHAALAAIRRGEPDPWWRYLSEREAMFYNPEEDRPVVGRVTVEVKLKKDRAGLPDSYARFGALDRQQGDAGKGELPHWWAVVRDFNARGDSRLVYEGKCLTDEDAADVMARHNVAHQNVVCDSGDDTTHVYLFCLKHGFSAIKGAGEQSFAHGDGVRRIFSVEQPLAAMLNRRLPEGSPGIDSLFWLYSKAGIRERLHWLRGSKETKWEVPGDVTRDYLEHMESEELQTRKHKTTGEDIKEWVKVRRRNDLFVCEAYIAMLAEMAGLIGVPADEAGPAT